jgi:hypothetical protein
MKSRRQRCIASFEGPYECKDTTDRERGSGTEIAALHELSAKFEPVGPGPHQ